MKEFACGDVVPGCGALFRAGSTDEIAALADVHARWAHGFTGTRLPEDVTAQIRAAIGRTGTGTGTG